MNRSRLMAASAWAVLAVLGCGETAHAAGPQDYAYEVLQGRQRSKAAKPAKSVDIHKSRRPQWWEQVQPASYAPAGGPEGQILLAQAEASEQQQSQQQGRADTPPDPAPPGVLTRQGTLVVEPSIEYTHTDINRFVVGGVAIVETVLVGNIEASQADRDSITATLGMRYGITDRLEAELRVPYMYRNDSVTNTIISPNRDEQTTDLDDHGLGDIEAALHWQMTDAVGNMPVLVANLRVKSTTGTGPFDVDRAANGIEEELATGSGFWGIEPSLTFIAPSDPAVFYGNIGYLWNVKDSVDKTVANGRVVTDVDPGDAIRIGLGMGLALNEKVSFSIGYQHDFIMTTKTEFTDATFESDSLSVGSLSLGVNWQMTDATALNVNVSIGVTEDAPDVRLMARMPIAIDLLK